MTTKEIILIILAGCIIAIGIYAGLTQETQVENNTITNNTTNITNLTNETNDTDNEKTYDNSYSSNTQSSKSSSNSQSSSEEYKVYNPQSMDYVNVKGEAYDSESGTWYTYDSNGMRYYNTRI